MDLHGMVPALIGGVLIGLAAGLLLITHGRIAGISGIVGGAIAPGAPDRRWRIAFLIGLCGTGGVAAVAAPHAVGAMVASRPMLVVAGLLVGVGTRLGNGCTSGHGVCGLAFGRVRSLVAVVTFMATAMVTVAVVRAW